MEIICKFNACVAHEPGLNKAQLPPRMHPGMHNFVIKEQSLMKLQKSPQQQL
jgi:hypothetical protein